RQLGPGIADADHRAAVEHVVRHAAVLHPAAIGKAVDVLAPEPLDRTLLWIFFFILKGAPPPGKSNPAPVENEQSAEASQHTSAAISSTCTKRPIGILESMYLMCVSAIGSKIAVCHPPAVTQ